MLETLLRKRIISFAGNRVGSIDVVLPLLMELKSAIPDVEISMYFNTHQCWDQLRRDPFLFQEASRTVDHFVHIYDKLGVYRGRNKAAEKLCDPPSKLERLRIQIGLAWKLLAADRLLLLRVGDLDTSIMRFAARLAARRHGKFYRHHSCHTLFSADRIPAKSGDDPEGDGFLAFAPGDLPYLHGLGRSTIHRIGYTRLYPCWRERLRKGGATLFEQERLRLGIPADAPVVTLPLSSSLEGVFSRDELTEWLLTAFDAVGEVLPSAFLLIKPHPMQDMRAVDAALAERKDIRSAVTHLHAGVLAAHSKVVVVHHTSIVFDVYAAGTPLVQHHVMTPQWLAAHPSGSPFLAFGHPHTRTRAELVAALHQVTAPGYRMPDLEQRLGQSMDLSVLREALT